MKQPDSQPDTSLSDESADARLTGLFQAVPLPAASSALEGITRRRIHQRVRQQLLLRTSVALTCVVAIWSAVRLIGNVPDAQETKTVAAIPLNDQELASLFAPPPVDPLALLDRQQQASYQMLKQWERSR